MLSYVWSVTGHQHTILKISTKRKVHHWDWKVELFYSTAMFVMVIVGFQPLKIVPFRRLLVNICRCLKMKEEVNGVMCILFTVQERYTAFLRKISVRTRQKWTVISKIWNTASHCACVKHFWSWQPWGNVYYGHVDMFISHFIFHVKILCWWQQRNVWSQCMQIQILSQLLQQVHSATFF